MVATCVSKYLYHLVSTYNNFGFHMFSLHITTLTYDLSYIKAMFQFTWVSLHRVFERLDPNWTSRPHIPSTSFLAFLWLCGVVKWGPGAPPSGHVDRAETDSAAFGICQAREGNRGKELWKCSGSIAAIAPKKNQQDSTSKSQFDKR